MIEVNELSQEFLKGTKKEVEEGMDVAPAYKALCRQAATEGMVLLKNEKNVLPIKASSTVSVFGRCQYDYFYVGYGSGGDVIAPYKVSLMEGLKANLALNVNEELAAVYETWSAAHVPDEGTWGNWPTHFPEMPLTKEQVEEAADKSDIALVVIGRSAGEDRESLLEEGSFYLTASERQMLDFVTVAFEKVVVILDCGNTIDFAWLESYGDKISAVLYAWQGGMESGNAIADVLSGDATPSGKLTSTIARNYEDYPSASHFGNHEFNNYAEDIFVGYRYFETFAKDAVLYPFGFGLSYTTFKLEASDVKVVDDCIQLEVKVTNTGVYSGKETVQLYSRAPLGLLGKPAKALIAFGKTMLIEPKESDVLTFEVPLNRLASYDDAGKTGHKSAWVLEAGTYELVVGNNVRQAEAVGSVHLESMKVCEQLQEAAAVDPNHSFERLVAKENAEGEVEKIMEAVPVRSLSLKERILSHLPEAIPFQTHDYKLDDVASGRIDLEAFVAGLTLDELEALSRGDLVMNSSLGVNGNAGVFGGVSDSLREKGVRPVTTTDGPSGIRLQTRCALLPCGTALASTWNMDLLQQLTTMQGAELTEKGSHVLLSPGMNIMRDPLCGRNFEYFSEDPYLTGHAAAAIVKGIQTHGLSACPKHFACNNQETNRSRNDSRLSERALREIYLKGFEICVKEASPHNLMTSYNKINGVWGHYHYDLCTTILRQEWGYKGNVVTDWWMAPSVDPDFPGLSNNAYRVRAQVDVLMPGVAPDDDSALLNSYEQEDGITLGELQRTARNVLRFVLMKMEKESRV